MGIPKPLQIIEQIGKLAQASKIAAEVQKIDNVDANGEPIKDGNPDIDQFFAACRQLLNDFNDLQQQALLVIRLQMNLTQEITSRLNAIGKEKKE